MFPTAWCLPLPNLWDLLPKSQGQHRGSSPSLSEDLCCFRTAPAPSRFSPHRFSQVYQVVLLLQQTFLLKGAEIMSHSFFLLVLIEFSKLTKINLKCLSYHFLERLCCLWFLQQQLLSQRYPARGFLRSLHSCCPGPLTVVRIHSVRFLHQAMFTFLCMIVSHCMSNIVILTIISITCTSTSQNSYDNSSERLMWELQQYYLWNTKESRGSFYLKLTPTK